MLQVSVKSIRSSIGSPCRSKGAGLVVNGCVAAVRSPWVFDEGTLRSSIGHAGFPFWRSSTNAIACLVICTTALIKCLYDYADMEGGVMVLEASTAEPLHEMIAPWAAFFEFSVRPIIPVEASAAIEHKAFAWRDSMK
jgi:hypothetical protein